MGNTQNLISNVLVHAKQPKPEVGMGVTICMYSDRHAGTITRIVSPKKIEVVEDNAKRVDNNGMSEDQVYEYTPGNGPARTYTLRRNGLWVAQGSPQDSTPVLSLGFRRKFYDFTR